MARGFLLTCRSRSGNIHGAMAYLRKRRIGGGTYYYIVQSVRRAGKVRQQTLQYLGRDPDGAALEKALKFWRVKPGKGKGR